ncbi:MAG TPA: ABC transporter ATP-binding protein [Planctomycetes bacterium]|nr:ABC transporter ATP-binding protein [Planctomycetota bacterium]
MIKVKDLVRKYGEVTAVDSVSFEIAPGEIVGLLGHNGAGKTTLMRILTSYLPATSGEALIGGEDVRENSLAVRRKIGSLPETPPLYPDMNVRDFLAYAARLKDAPAADVDRVLAECDLADAADKVIGTLSKGFKQRVGIAQAILNDPELLILDEPTSGLDPVQVRQVRKLITNLKEKRTVLLSTHVLSEIEHMAQRVLIIKAGKIIADESLNTLLTGAEGEQEIVIRMNGDGDDAVRKIRDLRLPGVETVEVRKLQQSLESVFIKLNE